MYQTHQFREETLKKSAEDQIIFYRVMAARESFKHY